MKDNLKKLMKSLHYEFKEVHLLKRALTHRSVGPDNYERFEFLGDAILSFVMSAELFKRFPDNSEGELSRLRAYLVKGDTLAAIARDITLGDYLFLGQGELKSGGFRRDSTLADSLEAVFAAVYIDGQIESVRQVILALYQDRLSSDEVKSNLKDSKTQLQELLQSRQYSLPNYTLIEVSGDNHQQHFKVACEVKSVALRCEGEGSSRRRAEQEAAKKFLKAFKKA